jgi:putative ABC transport system permease protein
LMLQAVSTALIASAIGIGLETLVAPASALSVEVPVIDYLSLPAVAVVAGVLASLVALRKAITVDPALAFAAA